MNIIKLKDLILPDECRFSKFFNENLKGKYAYWIQMRYIFPMESLDYKTYIQYEQLDDVYFLNRCTLPHIDLYSEECCMYEFAQNYVDHDATELANAVSDFRTANEYVADADIDTTKLKNFRSWLANEILMFNTGINGEYLNILTSDQIHMLEYYKNGMYNDVVKYLSVFGIDGSFTLNTTSASTCCCSNNSSLYTLSTSTGCNAMDIYVKNVHNLMVQTFENADFWAQFNKDFISVFKKYIDNIIKTGLSINVKTNNVLYASCSCNSNVSISNEVLKQLSEALQYIIDDNIKGHINFIHDALYNWADQLYDHMSWDSK